MRTAELADHVATFEPSGADLDAARASLLDTLCAIELGRGSPLAGRLEAVAPGEAFTSAALARADGFDDWTDYGAAGAPVWGALLAIGGEPGALLRAGCTGLWGGLTASRGYREAERGFDGTGVFGTLAAALACARLLELSPEGVVATVGIAASQAAGVVANLGTAMDALHAGAAARAGLLAARLAARGLRGSREIVEGRQGFEEAFFGLREERELVPVELATALRIKRVPGHPGHQRPALALSQLRGEDAVEVIADGIPATSGAVRFDVPRTADEARSSLRFALACTLDHGTVLPADHEALQAPLARVRVDLLPRWQTPPKEGGRVTVRLGDGTSRSLATGSLPLSLPFEAIRDKWAPYASTGRIADLLGARYADSFLLR